ncbi:MAG: hypothetical protein COB37_10135 [Kordiimonadales bacterium]|nr:MAG: hypothetical protein COB37_10135 [Kordiimonadales bacterium]
MRKVFCLGFHKTGTTSMYYALGLLGYRVSGSLLENTSDFAVKLHQKTADVSRKYDAFQDNPWPLLYREMDALYPDARFILTTRDSAAWIKSAVKHFGERDTPIRRYIYGAGSPLGNEEIYCRTMQRHNSAVRDYFATRPDKLLELDLAGGEGWKKLCNFLGHDIPDIPFPHSNKAGDPSGHR